MSKIQAELAEASEVTPSKRNSETITSQAYLKRLAVAIQEMPEADWNKLSEPAQDWYNAAADAIDAKKDVPEFPDMPKEEASGGRRRSKAAEEPVAYEPKEGDDVTVVWKKRGSEATTVGKIKVLDDEGVVIDDGNDDVEIAKDKVVSISPNGSAVDGEVTKSAEAKLEVGATVEITTKRGKVVTGEVELLNDTEIGLKGGDDFVLANVEVKVLGSAHVDITTSGGSRRGGGAAKAEAKPADTKKDDKAAPAAKPAGVTTRIRELMADGLKKDGKLPDKAAMIKTIQAEGVEVKTSTADLTYNEFAKVVDLLRERKLLD